MWLLMGLGVRSGTLLREYDHLPDDRPEKFVTVMVRGQGAALADCRFIATGLAAVNAAIGDNLARLPVAIEGRNIRFTQKRRIFELCHFRPVCRLF